MSSGSVISLWREGERRLAEAEGRRRRVLDLIIDPIVHELRRRLGGPFTVDELTELYLREGTDWCFEIAARAAPNDPEAWDMDTVTGAGFARYLRQASDYGGGRRVAAPDEARDRRR